MPALIADRAELVFVRLTIPLVTGILLGDCLSGARVFCVAGGLFIASLLLLFFFLLRGKPIRLFRSAAGQSLAMVLSLIAAGILLVNSRTGKFSNANFFDLKGDVLAGSVDNEPEFSGKFWRFEMEVTRVLKDTGELKAKGRLLVMLPEGRLQPRYGDRLLIPAKFSPVDPPFNPGEFDYRAFLANRQIYFQAFPEADAVVYAGSSAGNPIIAFALRLRNNLVRKFVRYIPHPESAALASTLILGYRADLSQELLESYSRTGTMHVLSVSGMHVGIVFMVLGFLLQTVDRTRGLRIVRALFIVGAIWGYALISGFSPPASRAATTLSFIVLGKSLNRYNNSFNLVAASAFLLLCYNPFYLFDIGFQLSYLAVFGLIHFQPIILRRFAVSNRLLAGVCNYCAISIAAQLTTLPLCIYYFHQIPVYFLLSNLLIVLPAALIMYLGIAFLFVPHHQVLLVMGQCLDFLIQSMNRGILWVQNLPGSVVTGLWIDETLCMLMYIVLIMLIIHTCTPSKKSIIMILIALMCTSLYGGFRRLRVVGARHLVFFNLRDSPAIGFIEAVRAIVVTDVVPSSTSFTRSVLPAVGRSGAHSLNVFNFRASFATETAIGLPGFYQFGDYRVVFWQPGMGSVDTATRLRTDILYLGGNPNVNLSEVLRLFDLKLLVIGSDNTTFRLNRWIEQAKESGVKYYSLRKNYALVLPGK